MIDLLLMSVSLLIICFDCRNLMGCFDHVVDKKDGHGDEPIFRIVPYEDEDQDQTFFGTFYQYLCKKCQFLKNCIVYSPFYTLNVCLIVCILPNEFFVVMFFAKHLYNKVSDLTPDKTYERSVYMLILCLQVLIVSLILLQLCVFIYICDVINTSANKHSNRGHVAPDLERQAHKKADLDNRQTQANLRIQKLRSKNILFHQFLQKKKNKPSIVPTMAEKVRTISSATTVAAEDSSSSDQSSVSIAIEPYSCVAYL